MASRSEDRIAHWRDLVDRQAASGLSVAAFCREESISAPAFYSWRRRLQAPSAAAERTPPSGFVPVQITSGASSGPMRIYLPRGMCLELQDGLADLGAALRAVREAALC